MTQSAGTDARVISKKMKIAKKKVEICFARA